MAIEGRQVNNVTEKAHESSAEATHDWRHSTISDMQAIHHPAEDAAARAAATKQMTAAGILPDVSLHAGESASKGPGAGNDHKGIWTTHDKDGNPTSDCHGPIPPGGRDRSHTTVTNNDHRRIPNDTKAPPADDPRRIPNDTKAPPVIDPRRIPNDTNSAGDPFNPKPLPPDADPDSGYAGGGWQKRHPNE